MLIRPLLITLSLPSLAWAQTVTVQSVTDGDTIRVILDGESTPVRFLGIDAPETVMNNACGGDEEIVLGVAATAALESLIDHAGWVVTLTESDPDGDRYGRLLARVWVDGIDVGGWLVDHGYARVWPDGAEWWCE